MEQNLEIARLCAQCHSALALPSLWEMSIFSESHLRHDLYPGMRRLAQSIASTGCQFCAFIQSALRSRGIGAAWEHGSRGTGDLCPLKHPRRVIDMRIRYHARSDHHEGERYPFTVRSGFLILIVRTNLPPGSIGKYGNLGVFTWPMVSVQGSLAPLFSIARPIPAGVLEDSCIQFILSSLQACSENCHYSDPTGSHFLPTRLIDVRGAKLVVVETSNLTVSPRPETEFGYLTLSYCWGDAEQAKSQLKLSATSEDRLTRGFPSDELSPIQQDAVALTRALGFSYLWIDALCIRQGDGDDWERESSQMHRIYAGSCATICALASASCREGFLTRGDNPSTIKLPLRFPGSDDLEHPSSFEIGHSAVYSEHTWVPSEMVSEAISTSRWASRGWTFQEEILSTRAIYLTRIGVIFKCSQLVKTEIGFEVEAADDARFMLDELSQVKTPADVYTLWDRQVIEYSTREFSSRDDVLPALSGLAQRFAAATGDEYIAGMWSNDLVHALSWHLIYHPHKSPAELVLSLKSPSPYVAPSWSWVGRGDIAYFTMGKRGLDTRLANNSYSLTRRTEWVDLKPVIIRHGGDRFGRISHGELSLTAHVFPLGTTTHSFQTLAGIPAYRATGNYQIHTDDGISMMFTCCLDWEPSLDEDWAQHLLLVLTGSVETKLESTPLNPSFVEVDPCGLIVHPADERGTYFRVGTFDRANPSVLEPFLEQDPVLHRPLSLEFLKGCEKRDLKII